jgi:hypothetical protein
MRSGFLDIAHGFFKIIVNSQCFPYHALTWFKIENAQTGRFLIEKPHPEARWQG